MSYYQIPGLKKVLPMKVPVEKHRATLYGDSQVGKTEMVNRFLLSTPGRIETSLDNCSMSKNFYFNDVTKHLTVFDALAVENAQYFSLQILPSDSIAVVCYDITKEDSFAHAREWIRLIRENRGEHFQIILVGNKADLEEYREIQTSDGENVAKELNIPFFEINSKKDNGPEAVFQMILSMHG